MNLVYVDEFCKQNWGEQNKNVTLNELYELYKLLKILYSIYPQVYMYIYIHTHTHTHPQVVYSTCIFFKALEVDQYKRDT